jgi:hypothetical protein
MKPIVAVAEDEFGTGTCSGGQLEEILGDPEKQR